MKTPSFLVVVAAVTATGIAVAAANPVKDRQKLMKSVGDSVKVVGPMIKGEKAYDATDAEAAMKTINGVPDRFVTLFPEGSHADPDTAAKPDIWENMADFESRLAKLKDDSAKAVAAAPNGFDSFKAAFAALTQNCKGCHEKYRLEKQ